MELSSLGGSWGRCSQSKVPFGENEGDRSLCEGSDVP